MNLPGMSAEGQELRVHIAAAIIESSDDAILTKNLDGIITSWNAGAERMYGYTAEEAIGQPVSMLVPDDQPDEIPGIMRRLRRGERVDHYETIRQTRDGRRVNVSLTVSPIRDKRGAIVGASAIAREITDRNQAAQALADHKRMQEVSCRLILSSDTWALYKELIDAAIEITQADRGTMQSLDSKAGELCLLEASGLPQDLRDAFARVGPDAATSCAEALKRGERAIVDYVTDEHIAGTEAAQAHLGAGIRAAQSTPLVARSGRMVGMLSTHWSRPYRLTKRQSYLLDILARQAADLIERTQTENLLRESERRYRTLFEAIDQGFCIIQMLFDEDQKPIDYRFIEMNPAFAAQTGLIGALGRTARQAVPDLEEHWFEIYGRVALTGEPARFTHGSEAMGRWFDVCAVRVGEPRERRVALLFRDITTSKRSQQQRELLLAEVRAEQQRLAEIFHHAPSLMCILRGPEHVFERANDLYFQLVGNRELIGKSVRQVLPELERQGFFELLDRVYETGEPYAGKDVLVSLRQQSAAGEAEDRWLDFVYQPLRDADGSVTGILVQGVDRTERKKAEEALRGSEARERARAAELEALMDLVPAVVFLAHDPDGRRITGSRAAYEFLRLPAGANLSRSADEPERPSHFRVYQDGVELPPEHLPVQRAARGEQVQGAELEVRFNDGSAHHLFGNAVPLRADNGQPRGALAAMIDITRHKQSEQQLQQFNQTLEQRVAERTAEAERRAQQLQLLTRELIDTEQRERRRLAQLLHDDLQQLLVATKMRLAAVQDYSPEAVDEVQQLLTQALDTSRSLVTELAPPVLHDLGLTDALEWLARWVRDKYALRVEVEADGSDPAHSEELRVLLFNAVRELLLNVTKHARVDEARIGLRHREGRLHVAVEDFGVGFDPVARRGEGNQSGYGLFSLHERLELLGGRVRIDSSPGQGTRVEITVPVRSSGQAAPEVSATESEQAASDRATTIPCPAPEAYTRVLLVDDHDIVRRGLANLIEAQDDMRVVAEATSGEEAIELAAEHRPDVVVMDISLPGISGIEATRRITAHLRQTCVIGLSMHEERDVTDALWSAGARAYFNKSQAAEELVRAIRRLVPTAAIEGDGRQRRLFA